MNMITWIVRRAIEALRDAMRLPPVLSQTIGACDILAATKHLQAKPNVIIAGQSATLKTEKAQ